MSGNLNTSGPGLDVAVANIATLSPHVFEVPREESDLNLVQTAEGATVRSALVASLIYCISRSSRLDRATYDFEQKRIQSLKTRKAKMEEYAGIQELGAIDEENP